MKIKTLKFNEITVDDSQIYTIPDGMLGFSQYKKYALVQLENLKPLGLFQSCDDPAIGFIVCDPKLFFKDYQLTLRAEDKTKLDLKRPEDMQTLVTLTFGSRKEDTTANLKGPLIINKQSKFAAQIVLEENRYSTKHKIFTDAEKRSK